MPPEFLPGLDLSRRLYREAVRPVLDEHFPGLAHTAALIGPGSEVLGFDTARSTGHDWGPRLRLFVEERGHEVSDVLSHHLPPAIAGYSTNLVPTGDRGTLHMQVARQRVRPTALRGAADNGAHRRAGGDELARA